MKLIIGLGNPGEKYRNSRHNVGFRVVESLARQIQDSRFKIKEFENNKKLQSEILKLTDLLLAKPQTFMNNSGQAVKKLVASYPPAGEAGRLPVTSVYVAHDDLDILLGEYKIQFGKGPKIHQGLASVEQYLRTKSFWRARIGIRGKNYLRIKASGKSMAENYVLRSFFQKEKEVIDGVVEKAAVELLNICQENNAQ